MGKWADNTEFRLYKAFKAGNLDKEVAGMVEGLCNTEDLTHNWKNLVSIVMIILTIYDMPLSAQAVETARVP